MARLERPVPWLMLALALLAAAALGYEVWRTGDSLEGPVPVAWDRQQCAHCRMLVSEPGFAAQLHTSQGEVLHFDDPGCLLLARYELGDPEARAWFHHAEADRWIAGSDVAFQRVETSPMAYGLAAHSADEGEGLDLMLATAAARDIERARVRARETADAR